ncbi:putative la-type HTH domain, winged helix-like DNA-binding domain superfamily [Helianthus annuus]|nr:putative la-type HTH domain, winged helix-like DNA-binding domain superfamily [Helianthus annuus]
MMSEDGGGDGYRTPARSVRVSPPAVPVVSVSFPAETTSSPSVVPEQIVNASTDMYPPVVSVTFPAETTSLSSLVPALQVSASVNPASTPNHVAHSGQRLMRRGGGISGQDQGQHRNFYNRNTNMQPQMGGYMQPSAHNSTPFIPPPIPLLVQPLGSDVPTSVIYFRGPPPPQMFPGPFYFRFAEPLPDKIRKQIEFYFSIENLVRDTYLRGFMDEQGWVPVSLIAGFRKVSCLTDNAQLILNVMQYSDIVEVQGDKMRRRDDWMRWLIPPGVQDPLV